MSELNSRNRERQRILEEADRRIEAERSIEKIRQNKRTVACLVVCGSLFIMWTWNTLSQSLGLGSMRQSYQAVVSQSSNPSVSGNTPSTYTGTSTETGDLPISSETSATPIVGDKFGVPSGFHSVYILKKDERVNLGNGDLRHKVRIVVPTGLTNTELENNLRAAAEHAYNGTENPHEIIVFAYKTGTDWNSWYSAGRLYWAPYGDMDKAEEDVSFEQHKVHFDLSEAYRPDAEAKRRQDALFPEIDKKWKKLEAKLDRRMPLNRRQAIYYAVMKANYDAMEVRGDFDASLRTNMAQVCRKYRVSADTADLIRTEGDEQGWPQPP